MKSFHLLLSYDIFKPEH